ncbi:hypothetical protein D3C78_1701470 [compost metagenome]
MDRLTELFLADAFFATQQNGMLPLRRLLAIADQATHLQRGGRHLLKAVADAPQLAADILAQPFQRVQQGDKAAALAVEDRLQGQ